MSKTRKQKKMQTTKLPPTVESDKKIYAELTQEAMSVYSMLLANEAGLKGRFSSESKAFITSGSYKSSTHYILSALIVVPTTRTFVQEEVDEQKRRTLLINVPPYDGFGRQLAFAYTFSNLHNLREHSINKKLDQLTLPGERFIELEQMFGITAKPDELEISALPGRLFNYRSGKSALRLGSGVNMALMLDQDDERFTHAIVHLEFHQGKNQPEYRKMHAVIHPDKYSKLLKESVRTDGVLDVFVLTKLEAEEANLLMELHQQRQYVDPMRLNHAAVMKEEPLAAEMSEAPEETAPVTEVSAEVSEVEPAAEVLEEVVEAKLIKAPKETVEMKQTESLEEVVEAKQGEVSEEIIEVAAMENSEEVVETTRNAEALTEVEPSANIEAPTEASTEVESPSEAEISTEVESPPEAESLPGTESLTEIALPTEVEPSTEVKSSTETETSVEAAPEPESEVQVESTELTEVESLEKPESEPKSESEPEPQPKPRQRKAPHRGRPGRPGLTRKVVFEGLSSYQMRPGWVEIDGQKFLAWDYANADQKGPGLSLLLPQKRMLKELDQGKFVPVEERFRIAPAELFCLDYVTDEVAYAPGFIGAEDGFTPDATHLSFTMAQHFSSSKVNVVLVRLETTRKLEELQAQRTFKILDGMSPQEAAAKGVPWVVRSDLMHRCDIMYDRWHPGEAGEPTVAYLVLNLAQSLQYGLISDAGAEFFKPKL